MDDPVQELRRISLFADLSDDVLNRIAEVAILRAYDAGETIVVDQNPCQAAYFVSEGQVRLYRVSPAGRVQVLALLGPGNAFNLVPLFTPSGTNNTTAQALTAVTAYAVAGDDLRWLVSESAELALVIVREFAVQLDRLIDLVEDLSLRSVRGRLARFLLENAEREGVAQRWTQEDIAAHLGTVRDMVGRTLRAFADEGLVRMQRQRIVLLDREGLETEAEL
jgi:CRP/FNR family transcriptional regulator